MRDPQHDCCVLSRNSRTLSVSCGVPQRPRTWPQRRHREVTCHRLRAHGDHLQPHFGRAQRSSTLPPVHPSPPGRLRRRRRVGHGRLPGTPGHHRRLPRRHDHPALPRCRPGRLPTRAHLAPRRCRLGHLGTRPLRRPPEQVQDVGRNRHPIVQHRRRLGKPRDHHRRRRDGRPGTRTSRLPRHGRTRRPVLAGRMGRLPHQRQTRLARL
jgi:hypothetical protein